MKHKIILFFLIILSVFISACKSDSVGPQQQNWGGLTGTILDTAGVPLDSVGIYCFFNFAPLYPGLYKNTTLFTPAKTDTFGFALYPNFPNPVNNSTYIKFALPADSHIELSFTGLNSSAASYHYSADYQAGLYQLYLHNLVDSLKLQNGPYTVNLSALAESGVKYNAKSNMFVVSDLGSPNVYTTLTGQYIFNYNDAYIGDSVRTADAGDYSHTIPIYNTVTFLAKRRGYKDTIFNAALFPQLLLHNDVVMIKEAKK
jgi:hypothetical protein